MSPIADTTTTRSAPAARSRAIRRATRRIRSASARLEPPNFWTTSGAGIGPFYPGPTHAPNVGECAAARPGVVAAPAEWSPDVHDRRDQSGSGRDVRECDPPRNGRVCSLPPRPLRRGRGACIPDFRVDGPHWAFERERPPERADRATRSRCARVIVAHSGARGRGFRWAARPTGSRIHREATSRPPAGNAVRNVSVLAPDAVARSSSSRRRPGICATPRHGQPRSLAICGASRDLRSTPKHGVPGLADRSP